MEDVRGGFNNVLGQEVLNPVSRLCKRGWCPWLIDFFRPRGQRRGATGVTAVPSGILYMDGTYFEKERGESKGGNRVGCGSTIISSMTCA